MFQFDFEWLEENNETFKYFDPVKRAQLSNTEISKIKKGDVVWMDMRQPSTREQMT